MSLIIGWDRTRTRIAICGFGSWKYGVIGHQNWKWPLFRKSDMGPIPERNRKRCGDKLWSGKEKISWCEFNQPMHDGWYQLFCNKHLDTEQEEEGYWDTKLQKGWYWPGNLNVPILGILNSTNEDGNWDSAATISSDGDFTSHQQIKEKNWFQVVLYGAR